MLDQRRLPQGQGPSKNAFFRRQANGPRPTSFTISKKTAAPTPSNWPVMMARTVNAVMRDRGLQVFTPIIDAEAHMPVSLLLVGGTQRLQEDKSLRHRTHGALLVAVNYYDRWLQFSLGSKRRLETESRERLGVLYISTNLSITDSKHDLCPSLLSGIPDVHPAHFMTYVYRRHRLGVKVDCGVDSRKNCRCRSLAESLIPAMWITQ